MADSYRIIGAEMSPYSVKVRSYFRYKAIPHQWVLRNAASQAEYEKYAGMPIIPLLVTPEGSGIQDSTPIIDAMERLYPEPSIHPDDTIANFVSALIEEFGDEWGNKWMFHYRWARDVDQISAAGRIARMRGPKASEQEHAAFAGQIRARMVDRVWFVGSNEVTAPQIEAGFLDMLKLLDGHLATRPYLFGGRTAFGDFGLPRFSLLLLSLGGLFLTIRAGGMEQTAQHEGKLLQRGDDDFRSVNQRRRQLLRVLINRLHHSLGVFDLVNRIL